ncbi:MAG: iron ABC transporter permease [Pseudomonadales bacterium]|nr:iron ABC transporter permease [Pseudomonadales bacterium]
MSERNVRLVLLVGLLVMACLVSLFGTDPGLPLDLSAVELKILTEIRLPRVCLNVLIGGGTAVAGAAIQGLFRNALADPALIGVSGGAALFAAAFQVLGLSSGPLALMGIATFAFAGGLLTTLLVLVVGLRTRSISAILLAGIAVNAVAASGVSLLSYVSADTQLRSVAFWALGSFNSASWSGVLLALVIPVLVLLLYSRYRLLNAITLGEKEAAYLGVDVHRLRWWVIICAALMIGISVVLAGIIAFVGLLVPHLVRMTIGSDHRVLLPASAILGGLLLVIADFLGRLVIYPAELPVGIVTSLLGAPFFLYLIVRSRQGIVL